MRDRTRFAAWWIPAALATILMPALPASGGSIVIQPTDLEWDTSGGFSEQFPANGRNGSGLVNNGGASVVENGDPIPAVWPQHEPWGNNGLPAIGNVATRVLQAGVPGPIERSLTLSLDGSYLVDGVALWNWASQFNGNSDNNRGINTAAVEYSNDGGTTWTAGETLSFTQVPDTASPYDVEYLQFTGAAVLADTIRINAINHGAGSMVGIGEVRLTGDAIPEPSSALLFGIGLLAVGQRSVR